MTPIDMSRSTTLRTLDAAMRDLKAVKAYIELAEDLQWQTPKRQQNPQDTGIRSKNDAPNDPTGDTVVSVDRVALRRAMRETEKHVYALGQASWRMEAHLREALGPYVEPREEI